MRRWISSQLLAHTILSKKIEIGRQHPNHIKTAATEVLNEPVGHGYFFFFLIWTNELENKQKIGDHAFESCKSITFQVPRFTCPQNKKIIKQSNRVKLQCLSNAMQLVIAGEIISYACSYVFSFIFKHPLVSKCSRKVVRRRFGRLPVSSPRQRPSNVQRMVFHWMVIPFCFELANWIFAFQQIVKGNHSNCAISISIEMQTLHDRIRQLLFIQFLFYYLNIKNELLFPFTRQIGQKKWMFARRAT